MKYLKIFEDFDKYNFGTVTDKELILKLWFELIFGEGKYRPEAFRNSDIQSIIDIINKSDKSKLNFTFAPTLITYTPDIENDDDQGYIIFSFSDYCYAIFKQLPEVEYNVLNFEYCKIIDGIEDLIMDLEYIINSNN